MLASLYDRLLEVLPLRPSVSVVRTAPEAIEDAYAAVIMALDRSGASEAAVGVRNYLIEGVSGTGKTTVCRELVRRGYQPSTVTGNWPIRATPPPVSRPGCGRTSTTCGGSTWSRT